MTAYVYDTEFLEDGLTINLISIGIVCEDGREYYAVNHDADWNRIEQDDWLMKNVVSSLPLRKGKPPYKFEDRSWIWGLDTKSVLIKPKWLIANEVREFFLKGVDVEPTGIPIYRPELWAYYGAYDHVALAQLWGKMISLPKGMPMWTRDLMELQGGIEFPEQDGDEHNALDDARWGMKVYRLAKEHGLL